VRVTPENNGVQGYTINNDINADPRFATYPSTTLSTNTQGQDVLLPGTPATGTTRYVLGPVGLDRSAIASARAAKANGMWMIDLTLTPKGSVQWDTLAQQTFHEMTGVVINGHVVSAPLMQPTQSSFTSFGGQFLIGGPFSEHQAKAIASEL
jgi:preprotein translocase subunit SecD